MINKQKKRTAYSMEHITGGLCLFFGLFALGIVCFALGIMNVK